MRYPLLVTLLVLHIGCATSAQSERLRGEYTFGHEVNVFCPEINSQCYWLGPNSSQAARQQLKQIYRDKKPGLYKPVCVVVEGACDDSTTIVPGDLNHRRWVLAEHNDIAIDAKADPVILDFGERLFVSVIDGCRSFSGFARLDANRIVFDRLESNPSACANNLPTERVFPARTSWQILREGRDRIELNSAGTRLVFRRDDWR
jgi:heat shock protein HslJ